jgi:hypothetical protein
MLPAIDLNDQILFAAHKINDERANRFLPNELVAAETPVA